MGSDSLEKDGTTASSVAAGGGRGRVRVALLLRRLCLRARAQTRNTILLVVASAAAAFLLLVSAAGSGGGSAPPRSGTFDPTDTSHVPPQCLLNEERAQKLTILKKLNECQSNSHSHAVVLACHRTWCNSWGHCDPCSGIGDRTRFLLSLATDAMERCVPVEIDVPQVGLEVRNDALYVDPLDRWKVGIWGFGFSLADVLHQRSYDVSSRTVDLDAWGKEDAQGRTYVHLTPRPYSLKKYDPCLFHYLFRPDPSLQSDIDFHLRQMGKRTVGIHLRTGDSSAFGIENKDVRASHEGLDGAVRRMLECADGLAERLYPEDTNDKQGNKAVGEEEEEGGEEVTYYLATDSSRAKDLAMAIAKERNSSLDGKNDGNEGKGEGQGSHRRKVRIYTVPLSPQSYLRGPSGDRGAWMEALLLSKLDGIVMNARPDVKEGYEGTANKFSTFARLAKNVGMIGDDRTVECALR